MVTPTSITESVRYWVDTGLSVDEAIEKVERILMTPLPEHIKAIVRQEVG